MLTGVLVVAAICVAGGIFFWKRSKAPGIPEVANPDAPAEAASGTVAGAAPDEGVPVLVTNEPAARSTPAKSQLTVKRAAPNTPAVAPPPRAEPTPMARYLVNNVVNLDQAGVPKTAEQIAAWKQGLTNLVQHGEAALPAIQEHLEKNVDFALGAEGARALGYNSTREALYGALAQIGGSAAAGVLLGTLQTTADPRDLVAVARTLEQMAPDQYKDQIVSAAREVLHSAPVQGTANQTDVALLFRVLGNYGGANAVSDFQNASGYKYYSAIALAQLPDGAGVPSLIQMVQDNGGGGAVKNVAALEALTQSASQNADARAALLQQVKANTIMPYNWAGLTWILSGDQIHYVDSSSGTPALNNSDVRTYHIASGNQNFYTAPPAGGMTADQISQQMGLIDELLGATSNPAAIQALQSAKSTLANRGGR